MSRICLVSCVRTKSKTASRAAELYTSPLFRKARDLARAEFDEWYILSAKYGLIRPDAVIKPYDLTLNAMSREQRRQWASRVFAQLSPKLRPGDEITFLAGENYCSDLSEMVKETGTRVREPLHGMGIGKRLQWLTEQLRLPDRNRDLNRFYALLERLRFGVSGERVLGDGSRSRIWPKRGVYFFFEPGESRQDGSRRVVRVGTHAVSRGSQSTLWHRLRTHLGTDAGVGNHRGSIFRLHIGAALLARSREEGVPTWGRGQTAPQDVRSAEEAIERQVSAHIRRMSVLWVVVDDEPGAGSDRAYIERNSIALLCGPGGPVDRPSPEWLGNFSPHPAIRRSGLWNVNYLDCECDAQFLDVFERFVEITLGRRKAPARRLAPRGWYGGHHVHVKQLQLFREER
jgi:hypothetical protein